MGEVEDSGPEGANGSRGKRINDVNVDTVCVLEPGSSDKNASINHNDNSGEHQEFANLSGGPPAGVLDVAISGDDVIVASQAGVNLPPSLTFCGVHPVSPSLVSWAPRSASPSLTS